MKKSAVKALFRTAFAEAKKIDASPTATLLALTKTLFADEELSANRLAELCNVNRSTLTRNAQASMQIAQTLAQFAQKEKESFPPDPFIKNKEKESSLRSDSDSCAVAPDSGEEEKDGFSLFLQIYPKTPKGSAIFTAQKAWQDLLEAGRTEEEILRIVRLLKSSENWTKENGRYVPNPVNFLMGLAAPVTDAFEPTDIRRWTGSSTPHSDSSCLFMDTSIDLD